MDGWTLFAVPVALGAAASFGSAGYLQHEATRQVPPRGPLRPRLIWDLLKIRGFRWSIVLSALAFALQVLALALAPLALVQPLLITQLICYLGLVTWRQHRSLDRRLLLGAGLAAAGLATFLLVSRPDPGPEHPHISGSGAVVLGGVLVGLVVVCLLLSRWLESEWRSLPLAIACAVCYGGTAGLVRTLTTDRLDELFGQWELYAVVVVAPLGFLLNQNAFQNGVAGSVAVSTITVGDPVVSIAIGATWLGERLAVGWGWTTGQVLALLAVIAGILLLTRRAQVVADQAGSDGDGLQDAGTEPHKTASVHKRPGTGARRARS